MLDNVFQSWGSGGLLKNTKRMTGGLRDVAYIWGVFIEFIYYLTESICYHWILCACADSCILILNFNVNEWQKY